MSNYSTLKTAIQQAVYTNENNEITGAGLQSVLLQIVDTIGDGYVFKGVATAGTTPGTPDQNVFYIGGAGTYTNFGSSYTVPVGSLGVFSYNGTWSRTVVDICGNLSYSFARRRATGCYFCKMSMTFSTGSCSFSLSDLTNNRGFIYHTNGYRQVTSTINKTFSYTTSLVIIYIDTTDNDAYMASDIQQVPTDAIILEVFYAQDGEILKVAWTSPFITKTGFSGYNSNCCFANPNSIEEIEKKTLRNRATGCHFCKMSMTFTTGSCTINLSDLTNNRGFIYHMNGYKMVTSTISKTFNYTTSIVVIYIDTTDNDAYMATDIEQVPTDAIILEVFYAQDGDVLKVAWTSPFIKKTGFAGYDSNCCFENPASAEEIKGIVVGRSNSKTFPTAQGGELFYLPFNAASGTEIIVSFNSSSTLSCVLGALFSDNTRRYNIHVMNNDVEYRYVVDEGKTLSQLIVYISNSGTFDLTINARIRGLVQRSNEPTITAKSVKIFQRVGCIGDSYTAGYIKTATHFANSSPNNSWPHYMEHLTGNKYENWGVSGSTAKGWMSGAGKLAEVQASGNKCQAYIVGLMINDRADESWNPYYTPVGVIGDIGTDNDTYYAWYYKLIQAVVAVNADAKIFCCTCPKWSDNDAYNVAVKDIVAYCRNNSQNVYLCDLASDEFSGYYQNETFANDLTNGHYTAVGYEYMAEAFIYVLSEVINSNLSEFKDVAFINFDE